MGTLNSRLYYLRDYVVVYSGNLAVSGPGETRLWGEWKAPTGKWDYGRIGALAREAVHRNCPSVQQCESSCPMFADGQ